MIQDGKADAVPIYENTMQFYEKSLRMGRPIDAGNIDFLMEGYGGQRAITVETSSILSVEKTLINAGIPTRLLSTWKDEVSHG